MKRISVVVVHKALIAAIGNTRYMFGLVNEFLKEAGKEQLFEVQLVGVTPQIVLDSGLYTITVDALLDEVGETDLIIIPPLSGGMQAAINENHEYIQWIREQYKKGAEVASLCVGAFLLAETGLLNNIKCSTHWKTVNEFKERYPKVEMVNHAIITDQNGLYTCGGANSYWNLLVYLVQKYTNRDLAIRTSKYFEVEMNRNNQAPFMIFEGYKLHNDELILEAQAYLEKEYTEEITLDFLSEKFNISRRTFQRRFKAATHDTLIEYLQKVRVEHAKELLESTQLSIGEVMFRVGYRDPKAFREVFKKVAAITPIGYKGRYDILLEP